MPLGNGVTGTVVQGHVREDWIVDECTGIWTDYRADLDHAR